MKSSTSTHVEFNLPGMDGVTDWTIPLRLGSGTSMQYQKNTDNNDICNIKAGLAELPTPPLPPPPSLLFSDTLGLKHPLPQLDTQISVSWNEIRLTRHGWCQRPKKIPEFVLSQVGSGSATYCLSMVALCHSTNAHTHIHTQEKRRCRWIQIIKINV